MNQAIEAGPREMTACSKDLCEVGACLDNVECPSADLEGSHWEHS